MRRHITAEPVYIDFRDAPICAYHNFPCPVCAKSEAVYRFDLDVFGPCWTCQSEGWELAPPKLGWVPRWVRRMMNRRPRA